MNRKEKEEYERKYRIWKMFLWIAGTFCIVLFLYFCRFVAFAAHVYQQNKKLQSSVVQIAQLTENIRVFYTVHGNEPIPSIQKMVEVGAIPKTLFKDDTITNPFGGPIVIKQAKTLTDKIGKIISPTFKISYQKLSHESCVSLATLNWGGKEQGLVAVAGGHIASDGTDTALSDIDGDFSTIKTAATTDNDGEKITVSAAVHYKNNVAKPGDGFMPTPFSEDAAHVACSCEEYDNCTFALNYTLFTVLRPETKLP